MSARQKSPPLQDTSSASAAKLDATSLSDEELKALREKDAFLYYSIPSVRYAALFGNSSNSSLDVIDEAGEDDRKMCPKRELRRECSWLSCSSTSSFSDLNVEGDTSVTRQTRISFEADPCCLTAEEVDLLCDDDSDIECDGEDDDRDLSGEECRRMIQKLQDRRDRLRQSLTKRDEE